MKDGTGLFFAVRQIFLFISGMRPKQSKNTVMPRTLKAEHFSVSK